MQLSSTREKVVEKRNTNKLFFIQPRVGKNIMGLNYIKEDSTLRKTS